MRVCLLNECEVCGRRWAPSILTPETAPVVAALVALQRMVPEGCPGCNPEPWLGSSDRFRAEQRLAGEGLLFIDGLRARNPETVPRD